MNTPSQRSSGKGRIVRGASIGHRLVRHRRRSQNGRVNFPTAHTPSPGLAATTRTRIARRRTWIAACAGVGLLALAGCAGVGTGPTTPAMLEPSSLNLSELEAGLRNDLRGTPVQVEALAASSESPGLRIAVPQPHGFEVGSAAVKPALAAVLDRLVAGLKGNPRWLIQVTGPIDPRGAGFQGQDRASAVRDYLVARGVAAPRFEPPRGQSQPSTDVLLIDRNPRS
jgi:outer membrane protein OmpA-like peptidoglycan-associated protein